MQAIYLIYLRFLWLITLFENVQKCLMSLFVKGKLLVSEFREIQLLGKNETFSMDFYPLWFQLFRYAFKIYSSAHNWVVSAEMHWEFFE